jgi:hypothetical protein
MEINQRIKDRIERRNKKLEKKRKLGLLGILVTFADHIKTRSKSNITTIEESINGYGRAGNRVYELNNNGEYILFRKFKNTTKAKKFINQNNNTR